MDQVQWTIAPYTEADLQSQIDNAPKLYGAAGEQEVDDLETGSPFAATGLAMPDSGSVQYVKDGEPLEGASALASSTGGATSAARDTDTPDLHAIPEDGSIGSQLLHEALAGPPHASNWELISAKHSSSTYRLTPGKAAPRASIPGPCRSTSIRICGV